MIFKPDAVQLIRERRKTQTRRLWPECRVTPGRLYSVQPGRAKKGVFKITVLDVRQEPLGVITPRDAKREGFRFVKEFEERWRELHGSWDPDLLVWVVSFSVGDLRDRFDHPRLLSVTPGHVEFAAERRPGDGTKRRWPGGRWHVAEDGDEHQDYTEEPRLAMQGRADPGEAVDAATTERFGKLAHARDAQRLNEPMRKQRDQIASALEEMRGSLPGHSGPIRDSVRRLERELLVLNRKLVA